MMQDKNYNGNFEILADNKITTYQNIREKPENVIEKNLVS